MMNIVEKSYINHMAGNDYNNNNNNNNLIYKAP